MKTAFIIYARGIALYAFITLPLFAAPVIYFVSFYYVAVFGWFAWALFSLIYVLLSRLNMLHTLRMLFLFFGTIASVAFAYQMIETLGGQNNVWDSTYILFPQAAVISGWASLGTLSGRVKADCNNHPKLSNGDLS